MTLTHSYIAHIPLSRRVAFVGLVVTTSILGCYGDSIVALTASERNRHVSVRIGERIDVTLQTLGPGEYIAPPAISSPAVVFRDVTACGAPVPAGPIQCFHFRAAAAGQAVITFTHSGMNSAVQDTVDVR